MPSVWIIAPSPPSVTVHLLVDCGAAMALTTPRTSSAFYGAPAGPPQGGAKGIQPSSTRWTAPARAGQKWRESRQRSELGQEALARGPKQQSTKALTWEKITLFLPKKSITAQGDPEVELLWGSSDTLTALQHKGPGALEQEATVWRVRTRHCCHQRFRNAEQANLAREDQG